MQKKDFSLLDGINMSLLTESERTTLYSLLDTFDVRHTLVNPAQQMMVAGIAEDKLSLLKGEISTIFPTRPGYAVSSVHACPAADECRYAVGNAIQLGRKISDLRFSNTFPHKIKVAIAGCSMCCTQPYLRDVGLLAKNDGWTVLFGGNGGGRPRIGDAIADSLTGKEAVVLVKKSLQVYLEHASGKQRTARFIERVGIEYFMDMINR